MTETRETCGCGAEACQCGSAASCCPCGDCAGEGCGCGCGGPEGK